jgi:hypothetical protein
MKRPSLELDPNVNSLAADASLPAPEEVDVVHLTAQLSVLSCRLGLAFAPTQLVKTSAFIRTHSSVLKLRGLQLQLYRFEKSEQ